MEEQIAGGRIDDVRVRLQHESLLLRIERSDVDRVALGLVVSDLIQESSTPGEKVGPAVVSLVAFELRDGDWSSSPRRDAKKPARAPWREEDGPVGVPAPAPRLEHVHQRAGVDGVC